jgi:hypothetical protein
MDTNDYGHNAAFQGCHFPRSSGVEFGVVSTGSGNPPYNGSSASAQVSNSSFAKSLLGSGTSLNYYFNKRATVQPTFGVF